MEKEKIFGMVSIIRNWGVRNPESEFGNSDPTPDSHEEIRF
jgi:hypothetical protein